MIKVLDLFSGCGGLSLGIKNAGLRVIAAIDSDPHAVDVYRENFPKSHILLKDLRKFSPTDLVKTIGRVSVDVIVGGPPCQGFSTVRQVDGANHGERLVKDKRRNLYKEFFKYVDYFRPKLFIMENVRGIRTAANKSVFRKILSESASMGYSVSEGSLKARDFGVPQKRIRQIFIGTRKDLPNFEIDRLFDFKVEPITLWQAIGDLPCLKPGEEKTHYDFKKRKKHVENYGGYYLRSVLEVSKANALTSHKARPHSNRDLRDFKRLKEGETGAQALERGQKMEFPYNREIFKDRYTRQHRNRQCSTIVAHMSKDGLMFIHPTQTRSLTSREAARIQSFPDWFVFPVAQTHQFRLIGNAVPPLMARAIGRSIGSYFDGIISAKKKVKYTRRQKS